MTRLRLDRIDDLLVTRATGLFGHGAIEPCDAEIVFVIAGGEGQRMVVTVYRLDEILVKHAIMWRMAIITRSHRVVGRLVPRIEIVLHDVTVRTGVGVVRKIRRPVRIGKRVRPDTADHSQQNP